MKRLLIVFLLGWLAFPAAAQIAVHADTIYTMAGPPIVDGLILIHNGKIDHVGPVGSVRIPEGYRTLETSVVTPGFVDGRSTVGLSGLLNQDQDRDALDLGNVLQPSLRAMDAYNARDELVEWLLSFGVTTVHTGHAPGALAAGQTTIVKTAYGTVDEALVDSTTMLAMTLGSSIRSNFESIGTRARAVSELRSALYGALEYENGEKKERDLDKEILAVIVTGRMPALLEVHRANDILSALRLAREFPQLDLILSGASESYLVLDEIRDAGIPVVLHPTMMRAGGERENATMETAKLLHDAGIPFTLQSGYEGYVPKTRVVLFEAAIASAYGLPREAALSAITIGAARILGISDRVGSIEVGKDADLALFDGDPLEYTSHVCAVIVDGVVVREGCR